MLEEAGNTAGQEALLKENIDYIELDTVRASYRLFIDAGHGPGIRTSVLRTSGARPLRFYRKLNGKEEYFFSCDRNREWLRCYARGPLLKARKGLREALLGDPELEAEARGNEVKVKVRSPAAAQHLIALCFNGAPLGDDRLRDRGLELKLITDRDATTDAFHSWYETLLRQAWEEPGGLFVLGGNIGFRKLSRMAGERLRIEFWVGDVDAAAVQINRPGTGGPENSLAGIAVDPDGARYLVRQGRLHKNNASKRIDEAAFAARVGIDPVRLHIGGSVAKREWYVVCRLDDSSKSLAAATADFVALCWIVRTWDEETDAEQARLRELFGKDERGGSFDVIPDPTPRRVQRIQGSVWEELKRQLEGFGIEMRKPRHARGYEVDAEILASAAPLLLEIKTGCAAADFYCAVGQLMLYPILLPKLAGHLRIFLLPDETGSYELQSAMKTLGIELHRYRLRQAGKERVTFSACFLRLCGVPEEAMAALSAF